MGETHKRAERWPPCQHGSQKGALGGREGDREGGLGGIHDVMIPRKRQGMGVQGRTGEPWAKRRGLVGAESSPGQQGRGAHQGEGDGPALGVVGGGELSHCGAEPRGKSRGFPGPWKPGTGPQN